VPVNRAIRSFGMAALVAAAITAALFVFGTQHTPDYSTSLFGQVGPETLSLKSWLATGVLAFAAIQVGLALWMYGRLPVVGLAPRPVNNVHRAVGVGAVLLTLPIAYHCALAYGAQTHVDARVAAHSVAGCFFYGAFAAKLVIVRSRSLPGYALPLAGGTLVTVVAVLWYTSALWYFNDFRLP
jgi:Family of unknown function (DUF6529)